MRLTISALGLLLSLASIAQTPYTREEIVELDTVSTAEALRSKARRWFVDTFKNANEVIQMDDPSTNTIVGKGWTEFGPNAGLHFTVEVSCKRGRYRYRIYDVHHKGNGGTYVSGTYVAVPSWGQLYDEERCFSPIRAALQSEAAAEKQMLKLCKGNRPEIAKRLDAIAASLVEAMKAATPSATDDW